MSNLIDTNGESADPPRKLSKADRNKINEDYHRRRTNSLISSVAEIKEMVTSMEDAKKKIPEKIYTAKEAAHLLRMQERSFKEGLVFTNKIRILDCQKTSHGLQKKILIPATAIIEFIRKSTKTYSQMMHNE